MRLKPVFLAVVFLMTTKAFAQNEETNLQSAPNSKVCVWLNGGMGVGLADVFDAGIAPMSIWGLGGSAQFGATVEWRHCHVQAEVRALGDMLVLPLSGYNIDAQERAEFLYRFHDSQRNRLHFWVGGGLEEDAFFRIVPSLGNASTSTAVFLNLNAEGIVQYDFAFIKNGTHNLLSAYGKLTLPVGSIIERPPYAFMDNYTSNINLMNTILNSYEMSGMLFPGISTDIGLRFNLPNGNKIGLSYRWDYLTTRSHGHYRFDNAFHTLSLDFMFNLF